MASPLITLTTDFGTSDPYAAVMKGVILGINPQARVVDITHQVRPQNILQASFLIGTCHRFFPPGSIHLVVVDPGVGTSRKAIVLVVSGATFVAPDNGVLTRIASGLPEGCKAYALTNDEYWLKPLSNTFHGRDVFAPVAAHLSLGVDPRQLGEPIDTLEMLDIDNPTWKSNILDGHVVHVDRFGNLVTDIESRLLPSSEHIEVQVGGKHIRGLASSYAETGELLAIIGSFDTLEISVPSGDASAALGADIGAPVRVHRP